MSSFQPQRPDFQSAVKKLLEQTGVAAAIGLELLLVEPGRTVVQMPIRAAVTQQHGFVHAGVIATLADTACGLAAFSLMAKGASVLSVNINLSLLRPAEGQFLQAEGVVVKAGRKIYFTEATIKTVSASESTLVGRASATMSQSKPTAD